MVNDEVRIAFIRLTDGRLSLGPAPRFPRPAAIRITDGFVLLVALYRRIPSL
jgi:hypothetical protein